jgi:hypothetical protein
MGVWLGEWFGEWFVAFLDVGEEGGTTTAISVDEALVYLLLADTNLTAAIGQRISPSLAISGVRRPCATIERISGRYVESMTGGSGLGFANYRVNCFAATFAAACEAGELVRMALQGHNGTVQGLEIQGITWLGDGEFVDTSPDLEASRTYGFRNDFLVHYTEA